jgi:polyhydroxybutyrate depolymerase
MRAVCVLRSAVSMTLCLVVGACAKAPPSTGTGGSGALAGGGGHDTGGATGGGGTTADASPDRNVTAILDAPAYASLDGPTGCGLAGARTGVLLGQAITVAGQVRTYVLSVPRSYDAGTPLALVFAWHGHGGTGSVARQQFAIEPAAAGGALFV